MVKFSYKLKKKIMFTTNKINTKKTMRATFNSASFLFATPIKKEPIYETKTAKTSNINN